MAILAAGWLLGALAWLRIDASEPLFPEADEQPLAV